MVESTKNQMTFASGAEALAYFYAQDFHSIESDGNVRIMRKDGQTVFIEHVSMLHWVATVENV